MDRSFSFPANLRTRTLSRCSCEINGGSFCWRILREFLGCRAASVDPAWQLWTIGFDLRIGGWLTRGWKRLDDC